MLSNFCVGRIGSGGWPVVTQIGRLNEEHREYLPILVGGRFCKHFLVVSYDCSEISCRILFLSSAFLKLASLLRNDLKLQQFLLITMVPRAQYHKNYVCNLLMLLKTRVLSPARFSSLVLCLVVRLKPTRVKPLSDAPLWGMLQPYSQPFV